LSGACKNWGKVSKEAAQKFDLERINLKKLSELEVRKQCQIDTSNSSTALWNLNDVEDIKRAWESVKENFRFVPKESLGLHERKQHEPWFMNRVHNFYIKGNGLKCVGYGIHTAAV
jgi:hypothetical protein